MKQYIQPQLTEYLKSCENKHQVELYLEKARQTSFNEEQMREDIYTREIKSIVDCDN